MSVRLTKEQAKELGLAAPPADPGAEVLRQVLSSVLWRLEIPGWRPALANELRGHPMKAARLKRRDADQVIRARVAYGVPKARGLRRVLFIISGRYSRFPDPDGPLKSGLDALKRAELIVDDSAEWCEWQVPKFERGPKGTLILLQDIVGVEPGRS
jgi:hypothetical protein